MEKRITKEEAWEAYELAGMFPQGGHWTTCPQGVVARTFGIHGSRNVEEHCEKVLGLDYSLFFAIGADMVSVKAERWWEVPLFLATFATLMPFTCLLFGTKPLKAFQDGRSVMRHCLRQWEAAQSQRKEQMAREWIKRTAPKEMRELVEVS